jgi:hypothetical protein
MAQLAILTKVGSGKGMTEIALRRAQQADAEAIARLHVQVWRETYRHLAPEAAFKALDEAVRLPAGGRFLRSRQAGKRCFWLRGGAVWSDSD